MLDQRQKSEPLDEHELEELGEEPDVWPDGAEWEFFEDEDRDSLEEEPRLTGCLIA